MNGLQLSDDGDDDLIEIRDVRVANVRGGATTPAARTPTTSSREPSSFIDAPSSNSSKRPASAVIDLTLSDDDEPPRLAKRQMTFNTPTNYLGSSHSK